MFVFYVIQIVLYAILQDVLNVMMDFFIMIINALFNVRMDFMVAIKYANHALDVRPVLVAKYVYHAIVQNIYKNLSASLLVTLHFIYQQLLASVFYVNHLALHV